MIIYLVIKMEEEGMSYKWKGRVAISIITGIG